MFKYKHNAIPAIIYLLLSIAALMYAFLAPVKESLAGVGIAMLALPWSLIGVTMLDSIKQYSTVFRIGVVILGMIINTLILLLLFGYFFKDNSKHSK